MDNPGLSWVIKAYIDLRILEYAKKISEILSSSKNKVLLDSFILNLNLKVS